MAGFKKNLSKPKNFLKFLQFKPNFERSINMLCLIFYELYFSSKTTNTHPWKQIIEDNKIIINILP
jgi:hypothetical protein